MSKSKKMRYMNTGPIYYDIEQRIPELLEVLSKRL